MSACMTEGQLKKVGTKSSQSLKKIEGPTGLCPYFFNCPSPAQVDVAVGRSHYVMSIQLIGLTPHGTDGVFYLTIRI